jgi:hypothetical protein
VADALGNKTPRVTFVVPMPLFDEQKIFDLDQSSSYPAKARLFAADFLRRGGKLRLSAFCV